jgi:uncharacterized membrane protein YeaQ/YmgE (transglycosylase-associated protein family)
VVGEIISAIVLGLIAGYVAKALLPGDDPGGFFVTILLGIAGALLGWFIFTGLLGIGDDDKFDLGGIVGAIIGTMVLLLAYRWFRSRSAATSQPRAVPLEHEGGHTVRRAGGRRARVTR